MEIESSILTWLVGGFCSSVAIWAGFAFKNPGYYLEHLSSKLFNFILGTGFLTFVVYTFLNTYTNVLKNKLSFTEGAVEIIDDVWKKPFHIILIVALALCLYFLVWIGVLWLAESYKKYLENTKSINDE
ncbi:hypothetical protein [Lelliottia nimipressuralis]